MLAPGAEWCGPQPGDPKPIVYLGAPIDCIQAITSLRDPWLNFFCVSYFEGRASEKTLQWLAQHKSRVFCDSGAFSFLAKTYQKGASIKELESQIDTYLAGNNGQPGYAPWIKSKPYPFDFYVTMDYRMEAPLVYKMTQQLRKLGLRPVPVYHGDSSLSWLQRYIDEGYKLIGISKGFFRGQAKELRKFYDQVFNVTERQRIACHGFACTGTEMWGYPWYSVDSSRLVISSGRGEIWELDGRPNFGFRYVNISKQTTLKHLSTTTLAQIKKYDLSLQTLQTSYKERAKYNALLLAEWLRKRNGETAWQTKRTLI